MQNCETKRLRSISFEQLVRWLHRNYNKLPIFFLGGKNHFYVYYLSEDKVYFKGEKDGGLVVDKYLWGKVMAYMDRLGDKESWMSKNYQIPHVICEELRKYPLCGPDFPAICKAYWAYHKR